MINQRHFGTALLFIMAALMTTGASATTVEVAKKCESLTARAFPPRQIGNPAAGSTKGTAQDQRAYFTKCVNANGKVDNNGTGQTK
jgi:hypothetical protein